MIHTLVGAYACHPHRGSEQGVGWTWVRGLAEHCRLDVITAEQYGNKDAIERILANDPALAERLRFHFLPDFRESAWAKHPFLLKYYQPLYYRYYRRWMWQAYELAQTLVQREHFDLVHQLTMIGYREPGYLWKLPLPFVWGPIGGTQDVPWSFLPSLGPVEGGRHTARNIINFIDFRANRRFKLALSKATGLISTASDTAARLREVYKRDSIVVPASLAQDRHPLARVRSLMPGQPIRLLFSGLHLSRKGLPFLLRALAGLPKDILWTLDVLGTGVMTAAWKRSAIKSGLNDRIKWHGQIPREQALQVMASADIFVFPSLQEGSPAVVVEALSLGMPVITTNHHGMADYIDENCGILIPVNSPNTICNHIASALLVILRRTELLERLSNGALVRAGQYSASKQLKQIHNLYLNSLNRGGKS